MGRLRQPGQTRSNQKVTKPKKAKPTPKPKPKRTKKTKSIVDATNKQLKKDAAAQAKLARKFHAAKREYLGSLLMRLMFRANHPVVTEVLRRYN